jgi:predicted ATPase/class 3 adenylate cyclase
MAELPSGTVTFLFTDLEVSTRLWEQEPDAMREALARHDAILREAVAKHEGQVVKGTGDGIHAAFSTAGGAVGAAIDAQFALTAEQWSVSEPLRVRMGTHTGVAELREGDYYGSAVNRAARLMSIAHGGQVVCSQATADLVRDALPEGVALVDLGEHRLRDLSRPEHVVQVSARGLVEEFPPLRSLGAFASNLPVQLTSFVGRDADVKAIEGLVAEHRMVTLTGVGGVGKTRLATHVAAELVDRFRDGAWLVELAGVDSPRVVEATAAALRVDVPPRLAVESALQDFLRSRELLLVVDNCEHVVREVRRVLGQVLGEAPAVSVLATSREGLRVAGEQLFSVPSLDDDAAARLFVERARAVDPGLVLDDGDALVVDRLCARLDGIPLAIELAAVRVRMFSLEDLARRVEERFRLLTGGRGDIERHQTLRAAIDWSYDLLTAPEQQVFGRLSVFSGGCTIEAAEAVIADGDIDANEVMDLLSGLVDKSLLAVDRTRQYTRYEMLETIRQYAQERLITSGEADALRGRHAHWYASFARHAGRGLYSSDEFDWVERLQAELDNLQAAVTWAVAAGDTEAALRIGASFPRQGQIRPLLGTTAFAEQAIAVQGAMEHPLRGRALAEAGQAAVLRGDLPTAERLLYESIDAQRHGARYAAAAFVYLTPQLTRGDVARSYDVVQQGLEMAEAAGDHLGANGMRSASAVMAMATGRAAEARQYAEQALAEAQAWRQPTLEVSALYATGQVYTKTEPLRALDYLNQSRELSRRIGIEGDEIVPTLGLIADLEAQHGNLRRALEALGELAAYTIRVPWTVVSAYFIGASALNRAGRHDLTAACDGQSRRLAYASLPHYREIHERDIAAARAALGDQTFEQSRHAGAAMTPETFNTMIQTEIESLLTSELNDTP